MTKLRDLVEVGFKMATGTAEALRPVGLALQVRTVVTQKQPGEQFSCISIRTGFIPHSSTATAYRIIRLCATALSTFPLSPPTLQRLQFTGEMRSGQQMQAGDVRAPAGGANRQVCPGGGPVAGGGPPPGAVPGAAGVVPQVPAAPPRPSGRTTVPPRFLAVNDCRSTACPGIVHAPLDHVAGGI